MNPKLFAVALSALLFPSLALAVEPPPGGGYPNENTALGTDALFDATSGKDNTALGYEALYSTTTGEYNVAVGSLAMQANVDGDFNVAVGNEALLKNINGRENVAVGYDALLANTYGWSNTAVGSAAMFLNVSGSLTWLSVNSPFGAPSMARITRPSEQVRWIPLFPETRMSRWV